MEMFINLNNITNYSNNSIYMQNIIEYFWFSVIEIF